MKTIIKGSPISEMDGVKEFTPLDEIVVSRVTRLMGQIPEETAKSYKISFAELSTRLVQDMRRVLGLSSMAYQDVEDYSSITHRHTYSSVNVYPYVTDPECRLVGTISVDGTPHEIRVPNPPDIEYGGPQIGEIKMIYAKTFAHLELVGLFVDATDSRFNGWVPCDGREYSKADFPDAFDYFRTQYDIDTFRVPVLSNFFVGNPGSELGDQTKEYPAQVGIGNHKHVIQPFEANENLELCAVIKIPTTRGLGSDAYCHAGGATPTGYLTMFDCDINVQGETMMRYNGGQSEYTGGDDETHPTYNDIPVLVFIGEKRHAD